MKKIFYCLIITILLSMLCGVAAYAEDVAELPEEVITSGSDATESVEDPTESEDEPFDLRGYIEKTVIPAAAAAIGAISAFCIAVSPLIRKIKRVAAFVVERVNSASDKFTSATDRVNNADEEKARTDESLAALKDDIAYIKKHIDYIEKIERIGFCHTKELVANGHAREIGKVGKDENEG